jgi:hypothetical protein
MINPAFKRLTVCSIGAVFLFALFSLVWPNFDWPQSMVRLSQRTFSKAMGDVTESVFPPNALGFVSEKLIHEHVSQDITKLLMTRQSALGPVFSSGQEIERAREQTWLFSPERTRQSVLDSPLATERRLEDDRLWIDYDMKILGARVEGDAFMIHLPGFQAVKAVIESVEIANGQYRWQGRVEDVSFPGRFSISQSFGDQYAVGSITTGQHEFLLEAKSGLGWITQSGNEFFLPPNGKDTIEDETEPLQNP